MKCSEFVKRNYFYRRYFFVGMKTRRECTSTHLSLLLDRCFPVASKSLQRSTRRYISSIGGGAACFATKCTDGKLFFEIPKTDLYPAKEFACPEGEYVDLTTAGIGYGEGLVGPCPPAKSVCMWHGYVQNKHRFSLS